MSETLIHYLITFALSMLPVVEVRGAVPYGLAAGLTLPFVLLVSIIGNMIPVPLIALFIRRIFAWLRHKSVKLDSMIACLEERACSKAKTVRKYKMFGLFLLVAIPLPGTGAWTGALVGALLDIRLKYLIPIILAGVTTAAIIICLFSYGIGALFSIA